MNKPPKHYTDNAPLPETIEVRTIGVVHSPFTERHGAPRQPGCEGPDERGDAEGHIELLPFIQPEALRDLERFSHLWLVSWFHLNSPLRKPLIRPPRPGPARGVFATRAPHRPNPLGLSAVELISVEGRFVHVRGIDLLDGTPIIDIKPYIPDYDRLGLANRGWLDDPDER